MTHARRRQTAILLAFTMMLFLAWSTQAPPAHADRCQPEELVLGPGNSPMDEEDSPVCTVMLGIVYPALGCDSTTLVRCINSLRVPNAYCDVLLPIMRDKGGYNGEDPTCN